MHAIQLHEFGPSSQLRHETVSDPTPAPGQVRIEVKASGVHLMETWLREGKQVGPHPAPQLPIILGGEVAGYIESVGADVEASWIGKPVVTQLSGAGGYAELAVADLADLHEIPAGLNFPGAIAMVTTGVTAMAIAELAELTAQDVVLVTAAAGGIGGLLIQHARSRGATVIGAVGSEQKAEFVRELGADEAVTYRSPGWSAGVNSAVSVVLDGVGGEPGQEAYRLLGDGGRIVSYGAAAESGDISKDLDVPAGVTFRSVFDSPNVADPSAARKLQAQVLASAASGELTPTVTTFPLAEADAAHAALQSRQTKGKVVLVPESSPEVRQWLREAARPLTDTEPDAVGTDIDELIAAIGDATVVGLGESTRAGHEVFGMQDRIWRALVEHKGFRALAIQDSVSVTRHYDSFVRTGVGDPAEMVSRAWAPWRTEEMVRALEWIRQFNLRHPDDEVRLFAVQPVVAQQSDYDAVLELIERAAPEKVAALRGHLTPIRTAHDLDEHVQKHRGTHRGRPFVEHARDAYRLVDGLPESKARDAAMEQLNTIVDFHENSIATRGFHNGDGENVAAQAIIDWQRKTDRKIAYWDGIYHTADLAPAQGTGALLRQHFGRKYVSVGIGFHNGDIHETAVPAPPSDFIDGILGEVEYPAFYLNLRSSAPEPVERWLSGPAKARVISGLYDSTKDAEHYVDVASLSGSFDTVVHIRQITPTKRID